MRIVFVNWADFSAGALFGGGVNGYLQSLALELQSQAHELISLTGGWTYRRDLGGGIGACRLQRIDSYEGVARYEIINSPVVAPGVFQAMNPEREISSPDLEAVFREFLLAVKPDVVHFHNIEGFSAGCIGLIASLPKEVRPATVFSLHNYHTVCPQVYLMRGGRAACTDFEGGNACASCMRWPDGALEVRQRSGATSVDEAAAEASTGQSCSEFFARTDRELQPLENDPDAEGPVLDTRSGHAQRRKAMVRMLSSCDVVLAVSTFVVRKFIALGVDPNRLRLMPIGTDLADAPRGVRKRSIFQRFRPLRLAFMGYNNYYKGLHMLVDSLSMMEPVYRRRMDLHVFAKDLGDMEHRIRTLGDGLGGLHVQGEYARRQLPAMLRDIEVGVVPSVWWDNGPQTVMEFLSCGIPVLGANLGGIPDLVRHGENGWLFRGNDRRALADQLTKLAKNPRMASRASARITPMISMVDHAATLSDMYSQIIRHPMAGD